MNKFIKPYELAKLKKVKNQSVYRWIREGKIPTEKIKYKTITKEIILIDSTVINKELKNYPQKKI